MKLAFGVLSLLILAMPQVMWAAPPFHLCWKLVAEGDLTAVHDKIASALNSSLAENKGRDLLDDAGLDLKAQSGQLPKEQREIPTCELPLRTNQADLGIHVGYGTLSDKYHMDLTLNSNTLDGFDVSSEDPKYLDGRMDKDNADKHVSNLAQDLRNQLIVHLISNRRAIYEPLLNAYSHGLISRHCCDGAEMIRCVALPFKYSQFFVLGNSTFKLNAKWNTGADRSNWHVWEFSLTAVPGYCADSADEWLVGQGEKTDKWDWYDNEAPHETELKLSDVPKRMTAKRSCDHLNLGYWQSLELAKAQASSAPAPGGQN